MTDTRRAEFVEALNKAMGEAWRRGATNCDPRHESLASAHVLALYDEAHEGWHLANGVADLAMKHRDEAENALAATAVQGGEPVAWRVFDCSHWNDGKPNQQTLDYWKQQGVTLQYAYAAAPPAARQEDRDAAKWRWLKTNADTVHMREPIWFESHGQRINVSMIGWTELDQAADAAMSGEAKDG